MDSAPVAIIGAGNGGQSMAAHLTLLGFLGATLGRGAGEGSDALTAARFHCPLGSR